MRLRLTTLAVLIALASAMVLAPFSASAKPRTGTGTATLSDTAGNLLGTVTNLKAVYDAASNTTTISGRFTDTLGNVTNFSAPLLDASGSCTILHLELGPVDLNLLGLMVHLDRVVLDITAQSGSGNLLGNLLCAVARLLDQNPLDAILADLTDLLNQIFRIL